MIWVAFGSGVFLGCFAGIFLLGLIQHFALRTEHQFLVSGKRKGILQQEPIAFGPNMVAGT